MLYPQTSSVRSIVILSCRCQSTWNWWWTKGHCDRFCQSTYFFYVIIPPVLDTPSPSLFSPFHQCCVFIHLPFDTCPGVLRNFYPSNLQLKLCMQFPSLMHAAYLTHFLPFNHTVSYNRTTNVIKSKKCHIVCAAVSVTE
jgi:hypothetical protein